MKVNIANLNLQRNIRLIGLRTHVRRQRCRGKFLVNIKSYKHDNFWSKILLEGTPKGTLLGCISVSKLFAWSSKMTNK